jgi:hypothetical protein
MMYKAKVDVFWDPYKTLNAKRAPCRIFLMLNLVVRKETARLYNVNSDSTVVFILFICDLFSEDVNTSGCRVEW